jgi:hypothetical protein
MTTASPAYERYLPWRRGFELGFWALLLLVNGSFNSITTLMDIRRGGVHGVAGWEPVVWEVSSGLLWALLIPAIVWFTRRHPLHWDTWRRWWPVHLAASVVVSIIHVAGMVGLRKLAYALQGAHYDFGHWLSEWLYEYLKDVRSYLAMVACIEGYRLLMRRLQGEVRLLDPPDEGAPVESLERPKRFLVRKLRREFLVAAADIEWLQATGNYVNLRVGQHDYLLRSTIAGIEAKLDPEQFVRIHRSYIVNLGVVAAIEPLEAGEARVHLRSGDALPCSRRYRSGLRDRVGAAA